MFFNMLLFCLEGYSETLSSFCLGQLKMRILFMMEPFMNRLMVWTWVPPLGPTLANAFLVYTKKLVRMLSARI